MEFMKKSSQALNEVFASIEEVANRNDWEKEEFVSVRTNNALLFAIYFNKEQLKAVFVLEHNFILQDAAYMVYAESEWDAVSKAACLHGHLSGLLWSMEKLNMMKILQPSIRRWEEEDVKRSPIAQTG